MPSASLLLHLILRSDADLADLLDQSSISASDLIRLARTPDFKHDLADLQSLIFTAARIRAVQNLSHVASASDDLVEQRRASTAILRATSPHLSPASRGEAPESARAVRGYSSSSDSASASDSSPAKSQPSSPTRHSPLTIRPPLPTHSAPDLIEHLIDKLQRADDYAEELEEDLDDDDLDEDRDPRDYALLALHAAFTHGNDDPSQSHAKSEGLTADDRTADDNDVTSQPESADRAPLSPALRGEVRESASGVRGYSSSSDSIPSSDSSSTNPQPASPTPDSPFPTHASSSPTGHSPLATGLFDGSPVPPDPLAFLALFDEAALDDLTNFTSHSRHIEDDEPRLYTERVILQHPDGRDIYRRFTFQRVDDQSPWRLTLVEPYDPEDIDPSDGHHPEDDEEVDGDPTDTS